MNLWISDRDGSPFALISSAVIWSVPGDLYLFNVSIAIPISKEDDAGTNGSSVFLYA
jgi:hypothetical protein